VRSLCSGGVEISISFILQTSLIALPASNNLPQRVASASYDACKFYDLKIRVLIPEHVSDTTGLTMPGNEQLARSVPPCVAGTRAELASNDVYMVSH